MNISWADNMEFSIDWLAHTFDLGQPRNIVDDAGVVNAREEVAKFALVWAAAPGQLPQPDAVRAFILGYRETGGHFESRGILDLTYQARTRLWWLAYNVRRDVSDRPGHVPDLTSVLLSGVHTLDLEVLKRTAALFDI